MTVIGRTGSTTSSMPVSLPGKPVPVPKAPTTSAVAAAPAPATAQSMPPDTQKEVWQLFAGMVGGEYKKGMADMQDSFNKAQEHRQKEANEMLKRTSELGKDSES